MKLDHLDSFARSAQARGRATIAAIRDAVAGSDRVGRVLRPELGDGVFSWHLAQSRTRSPGGKVYRPRHFLICRREDDVLVVGRVLHDAMELRE